MQVALRQIDAVQIRDLQFTANRRRKRLGVINHIAVIKIQACHRIIRLGTGGLLFKRKHPARIVELGHAVAFRVLHMVGENRGITRPVHGAGQEFVQVVPIENIVTQDQSARATSNELLTDQKSLRQSVRARLHRITQADAPLAAVPKQAFKARGVLWRGNNENIPNPSRSSVLKG